MTDTPETKDAYQLRYGEGAMAHEIRRAQTMEKLERERDHWRNEHDRVVREYQHRLVVIGISVIDATSYPESAIGDGSSDTNTEPMDQ